MDLTSHILYRDALILVLNKPTGIAVHASHKKENALDQFFSQLTFGLPKTPFLAHRLDKDTSGCLTLGRNKFALERLRHLFETHKIQKTYHAWVEGDLQAEEGIIDAPILKKTITRPQPHFKILIDEAGKKAITHFKVLKKVSGRTLVSLFPQTGRTHQLRVHMAHLGHPIIGDKLYSEKKRQDGCLQLHAYSIEIPLYEKKPPITVEAPYFDTFFTT